MSIPIAPCSRTSKQSIDTYFFDQCLPICAIGYCAWDRYLIASIDTYLFFNRFREFGSIGCCILGQVIHIGIPLVSTNRFRLIYAIACCIRIHT